MAMTLRLTADQDSALTLLAQVQGISKQEAVVRAIMEKAARLVRTEEILALAREEIAAFRHTENQLKQRRELS